MRKYNDKDRTLANHTRWANILATPREYPLPRAEGCIIHVVNRQIMIVDLIPRGRCVQHLAVFPNGTELLAGLDGIHAEIRKQMPPLVGQRNL